MKQDDSVTIIEQKLGYHYPFIGEEEMYLVPCDKIESEEDIHKYFDTRGHHLFSHTKNDKHIMAFEEAKDNNYIGHLGKYILEKYETMTK